MLGPVRAWRDDREIELGAPQQRRVFDTGMSESVGGGYALRPDNLDLTEFDRLLGVAREARRTGDAPATATALRAALGLWHGTPLAGVHGDFAEVERTRLERVRRTAIENLAAADIEAGRVHPELADVRELVGHTAGLPQVPHAVGERIAARPSPTTAPRRRRPR